MPPLSLKKYYAQAVLVPVVLALVSDVVLGIIDAEKNKNYKSEWLDEGSILFAVAIMSLLHSGLVCALSLTIFFNEIKKVSDNALLSSLAWFLIPLSWLGYLLSTTVLDGFRNTFDDGHLWVFLNTIPYVVGLVLAYINFRRELKQVVLLMAE